MHELLCKRFSSGEIAGSIILGNPKNLRMTSKIWQRVFGVFFCAEKLPGKEDFGVILMQIKRRRAEIIRIKQQSNR